MELEEYDRLMMAADEIEFPRREEIVTRLRERLCDKTNSLGWSMLN